ncbi:GLPGLI family protein [Elizabethkingia argentiflava]|uniref:GLPGLI family protein n=1 Tax=Elizabethkingia argenteiflava TaxID=2681556 RepID=A0A845PWI1_9FLAO|nr:GLPGLI family protein [Elizabethkingia argenteiflava]NAW50807.1 GLPGLI family protein [Elizabethkingia argenteiflava]
MKKTLIFLLVVAFSAIQAQISSNRFFYEFSYKPQKDSSRIEKVMTILDITKEKSVFRDYTLTSQDSIIESSFEKMKKSGVFVDLTRSVRMNKISYKIYKSYPSMKIQHVENIMGVGFKYTNIAYSDNINFNWKISSDKEKIGEYNTQKASTEFGGRKWTAWFCTDLPFSDGPYKFYGLPGLIVKIEDSEGNFLWEIKGNKRIDNFSEISYAEKITQRSDLTIHEMPKKKFNTIFENYKKDTFGSVRQMLTPQLLSQKMPGSDVTIGDMIKSQERINKKLYQETNNTIEIAK